jgi:hypothetical protein
MMLLGSPKRRWKGNIKTNFDEIRRRLNWLTRTGGGFF